MPKRIEYGDVIRGYKVGYIVNLVDPKIQEEARKEAAAIGGEEFVMDLGDEYKVVNLVDWDKAEKEENEVGGLNELDRDRIDMDADEMEWVCVKGGPFKNENGDIQFKDAHGKIFQIYAVHDKHGNPSAVMFIRDGVLQEFRVKEPSEKNLLHVRELAKYLNKAHLRSFLKLFVDDKGNCSAPENFIVKTGPNHGHVHGGAVDLPYNYTIYRPIYSPIPDLSKIIIEGDLDVSWQHFDSLERMPKEITGSFNCSHNELGSLKGGPKKVGKHYNCSHNKLGSLKDGPEEVGGDCICTNNQRPFNLEEYIPRELGGRLICDSPDYVDLQHKFTLSELHMMFGSGRDGR